MNKILVNISDNYNINEKCFKIIGNLFEDKDVLIILDDTEINIYKNNLLIDSLKYSFINFMDIIDNYYNNKIVVYICNTIISNLIQLINYNEKNINMIYFINDNKINNIQFLNNNKELTFYKNILRLLYGISYYITNYQCQTDFINYFEFKLYKKINEIWIYN